MISLNKAIETVKPLPAVYVVAGSYGNYLYKGSCRNLHKRLQDHRAGRVARTKHRRPLQLRMFEYCSTYAEARRRENYLKTGVGRDLIKKLLNARQQK